MARAAQKDGPEGHQANYDLAAYVWRRDRVDRWRNICGLTCDPYGDSEIDYLLGHKTSARRKRVDYRCDEVLADIAQRLERYVYDRVISGNPKFIPVQIVHGSNIQLIPFRSMRLQNAGTENLSVHLDLEALESGEYVIIRHPKNQQPKVTIRQIETKAVRKDRPAISENRFVDGGDNYEI